MLYFSARCFNRTTFSHKTVVGECAQHALWSPALSLEEMGWLFAVSGGRDATNSRLFRLLIRQLQPAGMKVVFVDFTVAPPFDGHLQYALRFVSF